MTHDVIVVGGGIVGASVAYHLARADEDVLLIDRGHDGRATDAGAGIVSPATSSRTGSDTWFELAIEAAEYYPTLVDDLAESRDGDVGYARPGLLSVACDDEELAYLDAAIERVRDRQDRLGYPAAGTVHEVPPEEASEQFPALGDVVRAFAHEGAARVDGQTLTRTLWAAGTDHGLAIAREEATGLLTGESGVEGVETHRGRHAGDRVVIAGGAWSGAWSDDLGVEIPVEPQRGQIAHLDAGTARESAAVEDWSMVKGQRGHYLVPRPDGIVLAGATRETGSGFDARTTAAGVRELLDEALRVAPGLSNASLSTVNVGLRPRSPDGLPLLGAVPGHEDVFVATGHGPTGLTLGPYTGKLLAQLVRGAEPETDLSTFAPDRF